ncbi:MAG: TIGR02757 family protein [Bacteroidota bacterium]|nr:TIGR02757 family protein [Bacteroidota bacterium]
MNKILQKDLKEYLDKLYVSFKKKYSSKDPVWILHEFQDEKDIEIIGLITSCYAYGKVEQINQFIYKFLRNINFKVYEFTSNFSQQKDKKFLKHLYYRFNTGDDLALLIENIKNVIFSHGSLQNLFLEKYRSSQQNVLPSLSFFNLKLNEITNQNSYHGYLIPLVENNSTLKRLNLYLRWMVRKDEIDLGIWNKIDKGKLIMPVDTHVYRVSRKLKLAKRKTCDMKFALELTERLKKFDELDPVKYDFALCHIDMK